MGRIAQVIDGKKLCTLCNAWKDVSLFSPNKRMHFGLSTRCRDCNVIATNRTSTKNVRSALRTLAGNHRNAKLKYSQRRIEMMKDSCINYEFLCEMWDRQDGRCAVTGVPMTHIKGIGYVATNVSVDRIHNDRGYERDNVRLVCRVVNFMKNTMSDREMMQWSALVLNGHLASEMNEVTAIATNFHT